jgi:hypothetical protein
MAAIETARDDPAPAKTAAVLHRIHPSYSVLGLRNANDKPLTVGILPAATATHFRTDNALASASDSTTLTATTPNTGVHPNPQKAINSAIITLSVLFSVAMVCVLTWYLRLRRREQKATVV